MLTALVTPPDSALSDDMLTMRPPAVLLQHDRRGGVDVVEAAFQIDRDGAVEFLLLDLEDALGIGRAGIVQQEIDVAPFAGDIGHHLVGAGERGDVGLVGERLAAQSLDFAAVRFISGSSRSTSAMS